MNSRFFVKVVGIGVVFVIISGVVSVWQTAVSSVSAQTSSSSWADVTPATTPPIRTDHEIVYDVQEQVTILFGGFDDGATLGDTWQWDGTTWTQLAPANSPSARMDFSMAYDSQRGRTVLFGGCPTYPSCSISYLVNDTWEYDGTNWVQIPTMTSPPARYQHEMVYDSARGVVVMFGGSSGSSYLNDTWEYDGTNWTQVTTTNTPSPRIDVGLAYHQQDGRVVLFGGCEQWPCPSHTMGDTWEYDGTNWFLMSPSGSTPPSRYYAHMVYDSVDRQVLLFGGLTSTLFNDTWAYKNGSWTELSLDESPFERWGTSLAYDSHRAQTVLFGGYRSGHHNDTWELASANALCGVRTLKINFQTTSTPAPDGFLPDNGDVYGARNDVCTYGWLYDNTANGRDRDWSETAVTQPYDTLTHMQLYGGNVWEIGVPNGEYLVHLVAGDPQFYNSTYKIDVENVLVVDGTPNVWQRWVAGSTIVTVTDGRLTLSNHTGSSNNKLAFIEITPVSSLVGGFETRINFQTSGATTPLEYEADEGASFGDRGNGLVYGWDSNNTQNGRDRNSIHVLDQRYDTLNHMIATERNAQFQTITVSYTWEIEVPNGQYAVFLVAGDPSYHVGHHYQIELEDEVVMDAAALNILHSRATTVIVEVIDGRLSLSNGAMANKNKIQFIELTQLDLN